MPFMTNRYFQDNDRLHLKVLKTKKNIQRLHLERACVSERNVLTKLLSLNLSLSLEYCMNACQSCPLPPPVLLLLLLPLLLLPLVIPINGHTMHLSLLTLLPSIIENTRQADRPLRCPIPILIITLTNIQPIHIRTHPHIPIPIGS